MRLPVASLVLGLATLGSAQHLWYNDPGIAGDMLAGSVRVDATAPYTYYEVLGWNQGGLGGGYTGIQDNGNERRSFIFSIWDPSVANPMTRAEFVPPGGSFAQRFGGEGTGYQLLNPAKIAPLWNLGQWVDIVVRAYDVGGRTHVAAWTFDSSTSSWTLQGIHDYPVGMRFQYGAMAFLENYGGQYLNSHRKMWTRNGFKRYGNGLWRAFTTGSYDGPATQANAGTSGTAYFMETGPVTNTVGTSAQLTVPPSGSSLTAPVGAVSSSFALYDPRANEVVVNWTPNPTLAPQFAYEVQVSHTSNFPPGATITRSAVHPATRSVRLPAQSLKEGPIFTRVRIVDLLDRASAWQVAAGRITRKGAGIAYASDLSWSSATNGWGPPERDRSNGETGFSDGRPITLEGVVFAKGIGAHANSEIRIPLGRAYSWFVARIGIDDEIGGISGSAIFRVHVDGRLVYDSSILNASTTTQDVFAFVEGGEELRLVTTDAGDGNGQDHTSWGDAFLIRTTPAPRP